MPAKLLSDNKKHVVIRPMAYCREKDIARYAEGRNFPIIPCNLCGSQDNLQRQVMKEMLCQWDRQFPGRLETIFSSIQNVVPAHLADRSLFDFKNLTSHSENSGFDLTDGEKILHLDLSGKEA